MEPLIRALERQKFKCKIYTLNTGFYGYRLLKYAAELKQAKAIVLHKLQLPVLESIFLHSLTLKTLYDVDDAIYLKQPKWVGHKRGRSLSREIKFNAMVKRVAITSVGNKVLARRAVNAGAKTIVIPTGIDVDNYPIPSIQLPQPEDNIIAPVIAVWVGLPDNLRYLDMIRPALAEIAKRHPQFMLRIISSASLDWADGPIEFKEWHPDTEKEDVCSAGFGIMPLSHDPYSEGKCAFKLLQYMAASLPCIGSPVGANTEVVIPNVTGYLADTTCEWIQSMEELMASAERRLVMGCAGRQRAKQYYDINTIADTLAEVILQLDNK
jgi:glycosyltransferase involved in cell wall biosynthesis